MKSKKIGCAVVVMALLCQVIATPFNAFAIDEKKLSLSIDTSSIEVKNAWMQIKNAAVVHLVSQKMKKCIQIGQVILNANDTGSIMGGTVWPARSGLFTDGVLDKGNVFKADALLSGDANTNIGVGPYMSGIFKGQKDGIIECNDWTGKGGLFDMFVYTMNNYHAGITALDLEGASATEAERLRVVCNRNDLTQPGLLTPSDMSGKPTGEACNSPSVSYYTGRSIADQEAYIQSIYNDMVARSNNEYLQALSWGGLDTYSQIDGYHLYSLDFAKQCGGASFSETPVSGGIAGFKVDDYTGLVRSGYYTVTNDVSAHSFSERGQMTCTALIKRMNELIVPYVKKVNYEVYKACQSGVDEEIDDKRNEINTKYINNSAAKAEQIEDANKVLDEYTRIQNSREYVATKDEKGQEKLIQVASPSEASMPTDYIWTCRAHLPYVDVFVQEEADFAQILEQEFDDKCYDVMDLAWVVCPVVNWLSNAVDSLSNMLDGFF